jgi:hypothetical protein
VIQKTTKTWKTCPRHHYWKSNINEYHRLLPARSFNMFYTIKNKKEYGCAIIGFTAFKGWQKITKQEYDKQLTK